MPAFFIKPRWLFFIVTFFALSAIAFRSADPDVLQSILQRMQAYHAKRPQQKLYLHFDKPFYASGDDVWFKAYLVEASFHHLDTASKVVYVELIDNSQTILQRRVLYSPEGVTYGDFKLPDTLRQGNYLVRAYTNYMKNVGEDYFFMKEVAVVSSQKAKENSAPAFHRDSINLRFFPEGGNVIACGAPNRVAFKALGPDGKSIVVEGEIYDDKNTKLTTFQSVHDGMGMFRLLPEAGKKYFARITKPYEVNKTFPLPQVNDKGYVMQVDESGKNFKVIVFSNAEKPASGKLTINLVVQSRGNVYHAQQGAITSNAYFTFIPRSKFPDGISQITLFDSEGRPLAERLVYQDQKESILLDLQTDNTTYEKRKQVTLSVDAFYRNGAGAPGTFSVSVYDEGSMKDLEKHPTNFVNYLSLTSELRGKIENPGYYFKDSLPETKRHLDLLMMVQGWRRFTWKDVLEAKQTPQEHHHEKGVPISGQILRAGGKKAPKGSLLKIMTMTGDITIVKPDTLGRFYSDGLLYYDTMDLVIQTENEKGKKQPYKVMLSPFNPPAAVNTPVTAFNFFDASLYLSQSQQKAPGLKGVKLLKEVEVVEERAKNDDRFIAGGGRMIKAVDSKEGASGYSSVFEMLHARVPGMLISGTAPNYTVTLRGMPPAFLINGMQASVEMVNMIAPPDVDLIQVQPSGGVMYGAQGVINFILKAGAFDQMPMGVNSASYPGFYMAKEFYSPDYAVADDRHDFPDRRTTLFWSPMVATDNTGKTELRFFTSDITSSYRVVVEGITPDGYPGSATATFEVK